MHACMHACNAGCIVEDRLGACMASVSLSCLQHVVIHPCVSLCLRCGDCSGEQEKQQERQQETGAAAAAGRGDGRERFFACSVSYAACLC